MQAPSKNYGRFALFIDGSNFYHTLRDLGLHVDYRRLLEYFGQQGYLVRASYYTALLEGDMTPAWLVRLTDWLSYNGYTVVTTPARLVRRRAVDDAGVAYWTHEVKGNINVRLAVDVLAMTAQCDTIVLFSGDGNFTRLVRAIQQQGCRAIVVSSEQTHDSTVADELRRQADVFLELLSIADPIKMVQSNTTPPPP